MFSLSISEQELKGTYNGKSVSVKAGDGYVNVKDEKLFFANQDFKPIVLNMISISKMTATEFQQVLSMYADYLENSLNNGIGKNGITLPRIDGIDYFKCVSTLKWATWISALLQ